MAQAWGEYYALLWRGDSAASAFAEWLAGYWEAALDRPAGLPDAQSPFSAGGSRIEWFERDGWVSGHVPGQGGGYLLPRATIFEYPWISVSSAAA
jgi:hypothetical protein